MALAVLMFFSLVVFAKGEEKCYGDLGCFTNGGDYSAPPRLISIMPQSPDEINTTFLLFTRNNTDKYQVISAKNVSTIQQSNFNSSRNTVFIVHGYTETGKDPWPVEMCRTILKKDDVNCICVDWSGGSFAIYFQAINNCQVVGAEIAFFINTTMERFNCSLSRIHLIGHSLGGQVVGEAGKRRPEIAQITTLDAASPGFEGQSNVVRVDSTDAKFVMAIHTDGGPFGLGMKTLIGHMDFFPNGGKLQTGCQGSQLLDLDKAASLVGAVRDVALCNHVASYYMYIEALLNPDGFMGYCASNYSSFQTGQGFPCSSNNCSLMGYFTKPGNTSSCRTYYLNTGPRYNYARYRCNVTVQTGGKGNIVGTISVTMYNSSNSSDKRDIYSGSVVGGGNYSALVDVRLPPPIARVTVSYNYILPLLLKPDLWALTVTVTIGNDGSQYKFCANETTRGNNPQLLTPCP